ncbi:MAG: aminoacetone oxidase family FAD-binding enzyme [Clostridia bacterium]|nr:aminoacetone oxidase family FAD-binding enzyme [Clostridia bacterium]
MAEIFDVLIIGGGASGLFLASQLPRELSVAIIESEARVGKKLLATGNGKCNLSNTDMSAEHYNNPQTVAPILSAFSEMRTVDVFSDMGLMVKDMEGRIYPYSECASSVLDVLRRAVDKSGTRVFTSHSVEYIERKGGAFSIGGVFKREDNTCEKFEFASKNVVLATGSPATFGKDSTHLYAALGHTVRKMMPSLVPIKTERAPIRGLQGVRVKAGVSIGDKSEIGEVLFKDFGVSGIAIFNLSAEIARGRVKFGDVLSIDLMPDFTFEEVEAYLEARAGDLTVGELLVGSFHTRLQERIMDMAGCKPSDKAISKYGALARAIKKFDLQIEGLGDKSLAQVMSGGLNVNEFDKNLMSKKAAGA